MLEDNKTAAKKKVPCVNGVQRATISSKRRTSTKEIIQLHSSIFANEHERKKHKRKRESPVNSNNEVGGISTPK